MADNVQNFEMHAGDDQDLAFTVKDEAGSAVDITGFTIAWRLATHVTAPMLVSKATGGGITITDAVQGEFTVALAAADTAGLAGVYYHEAELTDGGGDISTIATGHVTLHGGLT